ncbi:MAG: hypothetical protein ACXW32_05840 [Limisphaerales bacterium]
MPRLFQILTLLAFTLAIRPASGFSLGGPLSGQPGGEDWQDLRHGYSIEGTLLDGAIMSPKNLTHEYRRNTPIITYGFDLTFINSFGTNGMAAIDAAMAILNSLPNVNTISSNLSEYPLQDPVTGATTSYRDSRAVNYTARALNLIDMKSFTLGFMIEQLGLVSPERWTWTLRSRITSGPLPITNYSVIMRNFDPVTLQPTPYVNGNRYTYQIFEGANPDTSVAVEFPSDPESALYGYSSVANIIAPELASDPFGVYYQYLTRDDIGGLRYLYKQENLNYESFAPGSQIIAPDTNSVTTISNLDLASFSLFTRFNDPATVQAAFPNLVIVSNSVSLETVVDTVGTTVTNVRPPWSDPFTQWFEIIPILQTNLTLVYDYVFGNVITNYSSPTTLVRTELFGFETEPWSTPDNPIYRTNIIDEVIDLPSGGIIIVPPDVASYQFLPGFAITNVFAVTNVVFDTNIVDVGILRPLRVVEYTLFTNVTYGVLPFTLQDPPLSALRGGVGKINFERLGNASFTGTNFLHTNSYTVSYMINRFGSPTLVTNVFRQVGTVPDILFRAADLGVFSPSGNPVASDRSISLVSNAAINSVDPTGVGGPGNIFSPTVVSFSNTGPVLFNTLPGTATEEAALGGGFGFGGGQGFLWGVFDGSTNPPVVFPRDITLEDVSLLISGGIAP